jgi:hypothetical protein
MPRILIILMLWIMLAPLALRVARAQSADDPYIITKPEPGRKPQPPQEPWLPPKYQSPRGTKQHIETRRPAPVPQPRAQVPPPLYVPETGRLLPNLPTLSGAGIGGAETGQDRAARCAHQAGIYGEAAGNRAAYIGACVNQ